MESKSYRKGNHTQEEDSTQRPYQVTDRSPVSRGNRRGDRIAEIGRLGAQLILQQAIEDEVTQRFPTSQSCACQVFQMD